MYSMYLYPQLPAQQVCGFLHKAVCLQTLCITWTKPYSHHPYNFTPEVLHKHVFIKVQTIGKELWKDQSCTQLFLCWLLIVWVIVGLYFRWYNFTILILMVNMLEDTIQDQGKLIAYFTSSAVNINKNYNTIIVIL